MRQSDLKDADVSDLLKAYVDAAVAHAQASSKGNYQEANSHYDIVAAVYRELRHRGESAQRLLLPLLDHPNPAVKAWVAAHALEFAPREGEKVLQELSKGRGITSLNAEMTLKEWRKGTLSFP